MNKKTLPFSAEQLQQIIERYPTPFHIYDEAGIRANARRLQSVFAWAPKFTEYFAVKATPNPFILKALQAENCGADCSSLAELALAEKTGFANEQIMFTSNNTTTAEFQAARQLGSIINLDDLCHLAFL